MRMGSIHTLMQIRMCVGVPTRTSEQQTVAITYTNSYLYQQWLSIYNYITFSIRLSVFHATYTNTKASTFASPYTCTCTSSSSIFSTYMNMKCHTLSFIWMKISLHHIHVIGKAEVSFIFIVLFYFERLQSFTNEDMRKEEEEEGIRRARTRGRSRSGKEMQQSKAKQRKAQGEQILRIKKITAKYSVK